MRRAVVLLILAILVLTAVPPVLAKPPEPTDVQFVIAGVTLSYKDIWKDDHIKVRNLRAEGDVSGDITGTFSYKEKAEIDTQGYPWTTTQKGNMTIQTDQGKIKIRFTGEGTMFPPDLSVHVDQQPWTVKGGNGDYAGLKGEGTRTSLFDGCGSEFCVEYTGTFR